MFPAGIHVGCMPTYFSRKPSISRMPDGPESQSCTPASKIGTGYPTGWRGVELEPRTPVPADTGTRVTIRTLFAPLLAFERPRLGRTRGPGYPGYHTLLYVAVCSPFCV